MNKWILVSAICVFLVITSMSLLPSNEIEIPTNDKIGHLLAYAILTLNVSLLFKKYTKKLLLCMIAIIIYGMVIEFLQGLIPGRESSFLDILANTSGVIIGFALNLLLGKWIKRILHIN